MSQQMSPAAVRARADAVSDRLVTYCRRVYGAELVAVFLIGSYATGRAGPESDLDLLIVVESSDQSRPHRTRAFGSPDVDSIPEISPIVLTRQEFLSFPPFVLTLVDGNRVLYSHDDDAGRLAEAVDRWVEENGITRVPHKGGYYWRGIPT